MALHFGVGINDLANIISTAPLRHKVYAIAKRHGGVRIIAQPSRELKALQRYLLETTLPAFQIHTAATGYVRGKNILTNAQAHLGNRAILKLDFKDFFPSIKVEDWEKLVRATKVRKIDRVDLSVSSKIMFWGQGSKSPKCLSIGAPTSPALSNIILFRLDIELAKRAADLGVVYTRYADDITVSSQTVEALLQFEALARRSVAALKSPRLTFNDDKRGLYTTGQRRMVTGLVLTPTNQISIGRERKRLISVMLHKVFIGESSPDKKFYLKGLLGFCLANEPDFVGAMRRKYGDELVDGVLQFQAEGSENSGSR